MNNNASFYYILTITKSEKDMAFTIYTDGSFRPESMIIKHPSRQEEEKVTLEHCSVEEALYKVIGYLESNNGMN